MAKTRSSHPPPVVNDMMDTHEVAAYLRLKERRIYDLAKQRAIPHVRATGKLLFPRAEVDAWLAAKAGPAPEATVRPPIVAGSHDPLLEWAMRASGSGLAVLACGSRAGIEHLAQAKATVAAVHWRDRDTGTDNIELIRSVLGAADVVALEWARRTQGLLLPAGNPMRIRALSDLVRKGARVAPRQPEAGSHRLFELLLTDAKLAFDDLHLLPRPVRAETDLAAAIAQGRADAGFGIEAAARAHGLAFIALATERLDLVALRRDVFEPPLQALLDFARTAEFRAQAEALGGYDVKATGRVSFNS